MQYLTAEVRKFTIGPVELVGLMNENGEFGFAIPQLVELNLIPPNRSAKQLEAWIGIPLNAVQWQTDRNSKPVNVINPNTLYKIILVLYSKDPDEFKMSICLALSEYLGYDSTHLEAMDQYNTRKKKKPTTKEKILQLKYQSQLGGTIEVQTPLGRIDLLTEDSLFEFKHYKRFKEALGQVLSYREYEPRNNIYIVLFDCPPGFKKTDTYFQMITICNKHKIKLDLAV